MSQRRISSAVREKVALRASYRCEYCCTTMQISTQKFEIEHIIALSKGGENSVNNMALSCRGCNAHKSNRIEAIDAITQFYVPLFHPRNDFWSEHFAWDNDPALLIGLTPVGRATIDALQLNRVQLISVRRLL
ncbi:MAG: HNH endonuclease signature motif containing protein [Bacteroidota bacterium]